MHPAAIAKRSPDRAAVILLHAVQSLTHAVHSGGVADEPEVMAAAVWRVFWEGLVMRSQPEPPPSKRRRLMR